MEMKKEYLREFDALEMLLEKVAKFWYKMAEIRWIISKTNTN